MKNKPVLAFIGSGNTAWCLSHAFQNAGYSISGIASRNQKTGKSLAKKLKTNFTTTADAAQGADVLFVCVQDRYIREITATLPATSALILHCSGSAGLEEIQKGLSKGVFWPLLSMRSGRPVAFDKVHICIESESRKHEVILKQLAKAIGAKAIVLDSRQRKLLHIAAVFANNFSNACYIAADEITHKAGVPFNLLLPLLEESLRNAGKNSPLENQTGPARRNDQPILKKHQQWLQQMPAEKKLYKALTEYIRGKYS